ncbi:MAG: hypothetical protein IIC51_08145, partial [Planctomycetes bacterium]|nr:hypothetical protein [Planctomycetota bacterium]
RIVVIALGVGAVLLVINKEVKVYDYVLSYGWAILGAAFGPQMILALLWRRASYAGCLAGMFAGSTTAIVWELTYDGSATGVEVYNLPLAFAVAMVLNILFSMVFPAADRPALAED